MVDMTDENAGQVALVCNAVMPWKQKPSSPTPQRISYSYIVSFQSVIIALSFGGKPFMDWIHIPSRLAYPTTTKPRYINDTTILAFNVLSLLTRLSRSRVLQHTGLYETRSFFLSSSRLCRAWTTDSTIEASLNRNFSFCAASDTPDSFF